ncbi:unnamed protein product [Arabis nemorensis]|uniref:Uncharacterized protein n=1 Tax=Arabis nemorensis TaxID=586526 RepID=A0A565CEA2_9BRAS|nr:unnamed protein product [Arabis nemorensis]
MTKASRREEIRRRDEGDSGDLSYRDLSPRPHNKSGFRRRTNLLPTKPERCPTDSSGKKQ